MNFAKLVDLAYWAANDEKNKVLYKKAALCFLGGLAKEIGLKKGEYSIRFNPGGTAVSGEAILHHDKFYLQISEYGAFWRKCKGQKDYTGEQNLWIYGFGFNLTNQTVVDTIRNYILVS